MPDNVAVFAIVILLLPMMYFLLAAPSFLLVNLDIRPVALLMRAMFNGYFLMLAITGSVGSLAVAVEGRLGLAIVFGLIAGFAAASRRWFLPQIDARIGERDPGDAEDARQLRGLHLKGMASNAVQLAALIACIPVIAIAPAS